MQSDLSLLNQVDFVANKDDVVDGFGWTVVSELLDCSLKPVEGVTLGKVENCDSALAVAIVALSHCIKFLLASRVPDVDPHECIVDFESDYFKVNSYRVQVSLVELVTDETIDQTGLPSGTCPYHDYLVHMLILHELINSLFFWNSLRLLLCIGNLRLRFLFFD